LPVIFKRFLLNDNDAGVVVPPAIVKTANTFGHLVRRRNYLFNDLAPRVVTSRPAIVLPAIWDIAALIEVRQRLVLAKLIGAQKDPIDLGVAQIRIEKRTNPRLMANQPVEALSHIHIQGFAAKIPDDGA
jgi:hypothetical protein